LQTARVYLGRNGRRKRVRRTGLKGGVMVRFLVVGVCAALCAMGAAQWLSSLGDNAAPHPVAVAASAAPVATSYPGADGEASIAKSGDGSFWADAQVDGHPVHFLVDTGATTVALTGDDARTLGIDPESLNYSSVVKTANGPEPAARVKLGLVAVGNAQVSDVDAIVIDKGLPASLLGMTYLGRLSKFEATQDALDLHS
jgi:aspartyl protease family protein